MGFTLIEVLLVLALMGVLAAIVLPGSNPSLREQLGGVGQIVASDLAYARNLAVTNASSYRVTFDSANNRYILEHTGSNTALDALPDTALRDPDDPANQMIVDLDALPRMGPPVRIGALGEVGANCTTAVTYVEFGPLGETSASGKTVLWLTAGEGASQRYLVLTVHPVTGLVDVGPYTGDPPPDALTEAGEVASSTVSIL